MVYVSITDPAATPVTIPELLPTVAIDELEVDHVPPLTVLVYVDVVPAYNDEAPLIVPAVGVVLTVTTAVLTQPLPTV